MRQFFICVSLFLIFLNAQADIDRYEYFASSKLLILSNEEGNETHEVVLQDTPLYIDYYWIHAAPKTYVTFIGITSVVPGEGGKGKTFRHRLYRWVKGSKTLPEMMVPIGPYVPEDFNPFLMLESLGVPMEHKLVKERGECTVEDRVTIAYFKCLFGVLKPPEDDLQGADKRIIKGQLLPNIVEMDRVYKLSESVHVKGKEVVEEEVVTIQPNERGLVGSLTGLSSSVLRTLSQAMPVFRSDPIVFQPPIQDEAAESLSDSYRHLEDQIAATALRQAQQSGWGPKTTQAFQSLTKSPE